MEYLKTIEELINNKEKVQTKLIEATVTYYTIIMGHRDDGISMNEAEVRAKTTEVYKSRKELEGELSVINDKISTYQKLLTLIKS